MSYSISQILQVSNERSLRKSPLRLRRAALRCALPTFSTLGRIELDGNNLSYRRVSAPKRQEQQDLNHWEDKQVQWIVSVVTR